MGNLATFTVRCDYYNYIQNDKIGFANSILESISNGGGKDSTSIKKYDLISQKVRHASDKTIYVHSGNTVIEVNPYSNDFKKMFLDHPEFIDGIIDFLEADIKALKKMKKERKIKCI